MFLHIVTALYSTRFCYLEIIANEYVCRCVVKNQISHKISWGTYVHNSLAKNSLQITCYVHMYVCWCIWTAGVSFMEKIMTIYVHTYIHTSIK